MFGYPNDDHIHKHRKYILNNAKNKRGVQEASRPQK